MSQPLFFFLASLFSWVCGYGYFRMVKGWYKSDTTQFSAALFPFGKTWNVAEGNLAHMFLSGFKWFSVIVGTIVGGVIMLYFMISLPLEFAKHATKSLGW